MELTEKQIDIIVKSYMDTAEWADRPCALRDDGHDYPPTSASVARVRAAVLALVAEHGDSVREVLTTPGYGDGFAQEYGGTRSSEWPFAAFGYDMYLTSQGHGSGFWDRTELRGQRGAARLTTALDYVEARGKAWNLNIDFDDETRALHVY